MNNHPHLAIGQEAIFVEGDKKEHKGKITHVYTENAARIEFEGGSAIADFSDKKEPGTFHFNPASEAGLKSEHKK